MNHRLTRVLVAAAGIVCLAVLVVGQTATSTPRMSDRHPDLSGMWYHRIGPPVVRIQPGQSYDATKARPPRVNGYEPPVQPKYKPQYQAKVDELNKNQIDTDPAWYCGPPGVPRIGPPHKIMATPKEIAFFYHTLSGNFYRIIRMNAAHRDVEVSAHGDSIGRWEGDTLVVDVTLLDETTWLADNGAFHSDQTHVVERLRRDGDSLHYEVRTEDPYLAEPYIIKDRVLKRMTDYDIEEAPLCVERDREHQDTTKGAHAGFGI